MTTRKIVKKSTRPRKASPMQVHEQNVANLVDRVTHFFMGDPRENYSVLVIDVLDAIKNELSLKR